jgi:hypothetical protein
MPSPAGGSGGWLNPWTGGTVGAGGTAPSSPCDRYCSRLAGMGCPEATDQASCVSQCERVVAHPDIATLDLDAGKCSTRRMP